MKIINEDFQFDYILMLNGWSTDGGRSYLNYSFILNCWSSYGIGTYLNYELWCWALFLFPTILIYDQVCYDMNIYVMLWYEYECYQMIKCSVGMLYKRKFSWRQYEYNMKEQFHMCLVLEWNDCSHLWNLWAIKDMSSWVFKTFFMNYCISNGLMIL